LTRCRYEFASHVSIAKENVLLKFVLYSIKTKLTGPKSIEQKIKSYFVPHNIAANLGLMEFWKYRPNWISYLHEISASIFFVLKIFVSLINKHGI
jgi:hypothetical protein